MTLEDRIANLMSMTAVEVRSEWHRVFRLPVPPALGTALMTRAIAANYQEKALGGLSKSELKSIARQTNRDRTHPRGVRAPTLKPGTWLSRTWHGEVHEVVILDNGYEYRGRHFRSLSSVARHITGAKWSGPRFFGLHSSRLGKLGLQRDG